jgi:hypothetical protein
MCVCGYIAMHTHSHYTYKLLSIYAHMQQILPSITVCFCLVYIYVCIYIHIHTCLYTRGYKDGHTHMHAHTHTHTHTHTLANMLTWGYQWCWNEATCRCWAMYIYIVCVHLYYMYIRHTCLPKTIHVSVLSYIHTYIHTYMSDIHAYPQLFMLLKWSDMLVLSYVYI